VCHTLHHRRASLSLHPDATRTPIFSLEPRNRREVAVSYARPALASAAPPMSRRRGKLLKRLRRRDGIPRNDPYPRACPSTGSCMELNGFDSLSNDKRAPDGRPRCWNVRQQQQCEELRYLSLMRRRMHSLVDGMVFRPLYAPIVVSIRLPVVCKACFWPLCCSSCAVDWRIVAARTVG
jgi:hypothetical protein